MIEAITRLELPGPRSRAAFEREAEFLAPGTQSIALFSRLCIDRGEGALLYDLDGNHFIDLVAGVGVAALGYAHPKYVKAMSAQLARSHVGSFTTEHRAALVRLIASLTPGDLNRTQLYSSGAEAVEAALRLAKSYTGKHEVVGFWGGFHGKTGGVLPLLSGSFKHGLGPLTPGMYSSPYAAVGRGPLGTAADATTVKAAIDFLRQKIANETTNDVGAILVEPIQGTAGNIVPAAGFLAALRALADEIGALLIADEMICGFGRTGRMFGIEHEGVVPDIILCGKGFGGGFPMSGIIAREAVAHAKPWANPSGSSSSYGGNPLASCAARTSIETIVEEGLVEHSRTLGAAMRAELASWQDELPIVRDVRGRGMMIGFDLTHPRSGKPLDSASCRWVFDTLLARGVITMSYNPAVRINPPLVITEEQAMAALATMKDVLVEATARAG